MNPDLYIYQDFSHNCTTNTMCIGHQTRQSTQVTSSDFPKNSPMKPMRPLTGYHIFFQIEREYIIQTTAGSDADPSIHDHKFYLSDVPRRYRNIKLSTDWYAGPGKRAKRKHRKSHGKIGFLELSRVVSQRWANLGEEDPETMAFVTGIAKRELEQYKKELKAYEAAAKGVGLDDTDEDPVPAKVSKSAKKVGTKRTARKNAQPVTPLPSAAAPEVVPSYTCEMNQSYASRRTLVTPPATPPPTELFFPETFDITNVFNDIVSDSTFSSTIESSENMSLPDQVDYSISYVDKAGHHIPSPSSSVCGDRKRTISEESICDPLFELDVAQDVLATPSKRRRMSAGGFDREFYNNLWQ